MPIKIVNYGAANIRTVELHSALWRVMVNFNERVSQLDPFQLATPCWNPSSRGYLAELYPYTPIERKRKKKRMPIKIRQVADLPERTIFRTPAVPEVQEVLDALPKLKAKEALEVTLSDETQHLYAKNKMGKPVVPAKKLVSVLKRKFTTDGLAYSAYTADGKSVIVVRDK